MADGFGTNKDLNLGLINKLVAEELQERALELGSAVSIGKASRLEKIVGKGYSARSEADVAYRGKPLGSGKIYIILFRPMDGTGNNKDYNLKGVPGKWTPRNKTGYAELYISAGTGVANTWIRGFTSLSASSLDELGKGIREYKILTRSHREFDNSTMRGNLNYGRFLRKTHYPASHFDFTFDSGARPAYGNLHAVLWDEPVLRNGLGAEAFFQVGCFLSFPKKDKGYTLAKRAVKESAERLASCALPDSS